MNYTPYQSGLVGSLVLLRNIRATPGETLCTLVDPEEESFENFMSAFKDFLKRCNDTIDFAHFHQNCLSFSQKYYLCLIFPLDKTLSNVVM